MILPKTARSGSSPSPRGDALNADHQLLRCGQLRAEHVLHLFESVQRDPQPRQAIPRLRAWVRREITMTRARCRWSRWRRRIAQRREDTDICGRTGCGRGACFGAQLGAAAYAIKTARTAVVASERDEQVTGISMATAKQLPDTILIWFVDDQRLRNEICWAVFDC